MTRNVVIFAREPRLGRVKRRLAADIGDVAALRFYRATLEAVARRVGRDPRWRTWLAVTPDALARREDGWLPALPRIAQGAGDLGDRMERALTRFGSAPALVVGSDIPDLGPRQIVAAFDALRRSDVVFGPAADGGYWLVGAAHGARARGLFRNVRWSSPHALDDTLANCRAARVATLSPLVDVDDGDAYRARKQASTPVRR